MPKGDISLDTSLSVWVFSVPFESTGKVKRSHGYHVVKQRSNAFIGEVLFSLVEDKTQLTRKGPKALPWRFQNKNTTSETNI